MYMYMCLCFHFCRSSLLKKEKVPRHRQPMWRRRMEPAVDTKTSEAVRTLLEAVKERNTQQVRLLLALNEGIQVATGHNKKNALCVAAQEGHADIMDILLTDAVHPDVSDLSDTMWRRKAIHHAAARGHVRVVEKLVESGADINIVDDDSRTPLLWAATNGWVSVAEYLINHGAAINLAQREGFTPLHAATYLGHLPMCQFLLSRGADINSADRDGWTPLHAAVCYGHPQIVRLYLQSGADVNKKTRDEETALHIATDHCNKPYEVILGGLLTYGAKLEEKNIDGFSPFFESVWRNKYGVSRYLIDMGADLNVKNNAGHSALLIATMRSAKNFMQLLVSAGCDLQAETWIRQDQVPVALDEQKELYHWLRYHARNPPNLQMLSTWVIRKQLKTNVSKKILSLPLPLKLQGLVSLDFL